MRFPFQYRFNDLFFLQILHAVEGDGGDNDKTLKHELQVGVDAEKG